MYTQDVGDKCKARRRITRIRGYTFYIKTFEENLGQGGEASHGSGEGHCEWAQSTCDMCEEQNGRSGMGPGCWSSEREDVRTGRGQDSVQGTLVDCFHLHPYAIPIF